MRAPGSLLSLSPLYPLGLPSSHKPYHTECTVYMLHDTLLDFTFYGHLSSRLVCVVAGANPPFICLNKRQCGITFLSVSTVRPRTNTMVSIGVFPHILVPNFAKAGSVTPAMPLRRRSTPQHAEFPVRCTSARVQSGVDRRDSIAGCAWLVSGISIVVLLS